MPMPHAIEARPFYRAAIHRFDEAEFLLEGGRRTGAIYLAGYGVECMLKSLIISVVPAARRGDLVATFRGQRAHNYDWLRYQYLQNGGAQFPPDIAKAFALVNTWDTELRYETREATPREAEGFLSSAKRIIQWANGRL